MKNKVWLFTAALLLFTAGCGKTDLTEKEINGDEQKTIESQETEKTTEKDGNASGEKKYTGSGFFRTEDQCVV